MIVDIALDCNGKQLYQVHESSKFIRKEMPKSTKFYGDAVDSEGEEKTPIRRILGTISPRTLNKKFSEEEDEEKDDDRIKQEHEEFNVKGFNYEYADLRQSHGEGDGHSNNDYIMPNEDSRSGEIISEDITKSHDIWSEDVEQAFEEILSIIPKKGLSKIKISGRSCGRNELISDYILTKTGKFRTRKQVSSHIQVIKNLGQKVDIIRLINDGPTFRDEAEQAQNMKTFEEIFSKINLDKSLGLNKKRQFHDISLGQQKGPNVISPILGKKVNKHNPLYMQSISLENFYMSVYDNLLANPIVLTVQNCQQVRNLKLKPNANISNRFPDLNEFKNFPIVHNLVNIYLPPLPINYSIDSGLKANIFLKDDTTDTPVSIFTIVYRYGKEIFKVNENVKLNENQNFLLKFWKYFLANELSENLNHITIKQVVHQQLDLSDSVESIEQRTVTNIKLSKSKIKSVLLWEFLKVEDPKAAITTTSRITLPDEIVPQAVKYNNNNFNDIGSINSTPAQQYPPFTSQSLPNVTQIKEEMTFETNDKQKFLKPHSITKKFQSLNEYDYYSQPYYQSYNQGLPPQAPATAQAIGGSAALGLGPIPGQQMPPLHPNQASLIQSQALQNNTGMPQAIPLGMDYDYQFLYEPNYPEY